MRLSLVTFLALVGAAAALGQIVSGPPPVSVGSNLPAQPIGPNDLIAVSIYGSPELSRTIRVGSDGLIRLPMAKNKIKAEGLYPADLEASIASTLTEEHLLADPYVTVTVSEYNSHPISVSGAVNKPLVLQAATAITLRDALAQAGGLRDDAGGEILVSRSETDGAAGAKLVTQRIPKRALMDASDASLNLVLKGDEDVLVPVVQKIYVVGNVKKSGAFPVQDGGQTTVLKLLALAEGLAPFAAKEAYVYSTDASGAKKETPILLTKIMQRKSPDLPLAANDILYIPDATGKRLAASVLSRIATAGTLVAGSAAVYH